MCNNSANCVICGQKKIENVIKFTSKTIKKFKTVLEYRRSKPVRRKSRSTYNDVEFSDETSLNDGYHAQCYKLFTAIKIPPNFQKQLKSEAEYGNAPEDSGEDTELYFPVTSSTQVAGTSSYEVGVSNNFERGFDDSDEKFHTGEPDSNEDLPPVKCFICERTRKRHHGREVPLAINRFRTIDLLKSVAAEHNDIEMLEKIRTFSDNSNIPYHKCCKDQYLRDISKGDESDFVTKRKASKTAYEMLCKMLEEYVVKNNECLFFDHVKKQYHKLLIEQCKPLSDSLSSTSFSEVYLERKLMNTFNNKIKIIHAEKKKFIAPFSAHIFNYNDLFKTMAMKETIRLVAAQLLKP